MKQYRVEARCLIFLVALLFSSPSFFSSEPSHSLKGLKWRNPRIVISLSRSLESSSNIHAAVDRAVERSLYSWSSPTTISFQLETSDAESVSPKGMRGDGISLVTAATTPQNLRLFPKQGDSPAAVTRIFKDSLGFITEADIVLNPFVKFSADGSFDTYDLQATLTHEIGHLLGLEHSPIWSSVMYERLSKSSGPAFFRKPRENLAQVDASAIKALYGPSPYDVQCCGAVRGRLEANLVERRALIWVEEAENGRLVAATMPEKDGSYHLEGVPEGDYLLRALATGRDQYFASVSSKIAVTVAETTIQNFDLRPARSDVEVQLLGSSIQIARQAADLRSLSSGLFLGVFGTPGSISSVRISGSDVGFEPSVTRPPSFASVRVVGFQPNGHLNLPEGEYTLVITANNGVRQYLVGSLINY